MKRITLNTSEQMLFALLRSSLHEKEVEVECFQEASDDAWKRCYQLAVAPERKGCGDTGKMPCRFLAADGCGAVPLPGQACASSHHS